MFPGDEIDFDTDAVDEWAAAVEEAGFDHVVFGDHVVGVEPSMAEPGWDRDWPGPRGAGGAYTVANVFREPLVLFGYLAASTRLELVSAVIVLPQRQTVLFAKQAAEVDLLSRGRLRLAVGVGWSPVEYQALGVPYQTRGRLLDEQIELARLLWTRPAVSFDGAFHRCTGVGLGALPVQRPIPLWLGGDSRRALERLGRLGDGYFAPGRMMPDGATADALRLARGAATAAGRDPDFGIEVKVVVGRRDDRELEDLIRRWARLGATHVCIDTRYGGLATMGDHVTALQRAAARLL